MACLRPRRCHMRAKAPRPCHTEQDGSPACRKPDHDLTLAPATYGDPSTRSPARCWGVPAGRWCRLRLGDSKPAQSRGFRGAAGVPHHRARSRLVCMRGAAPVKISPINMVVRRTRLVSLQDGCCLLLHPLLCPLLCFPYISSHRLSTPRTPDLSLLTLLCSSPSLFI